MAKANIGLQSFNRGLISKYGLARVDIKRVGLSASLMTNWMPKILGSMALRAGLGWIGSTTNSGANQAIQVPFIFSTSDTALLEITSTVMRVRVNDVLVSRVAVSTVMTNGDFSSLTGWTSVDETSATSANTSSKLNLTGTGYNAAGREQHVTVAGGDVNKQHALRIVVERGPVKFRVGSASDGDDYVAETDLRTGTHSIAFTPTGDFYVRFFSTSRSIKYVDSVQVEAAGVLTLPVPWITITDFRNMRWDQSGDVIFVACDGFQQRRIERRSNNSWSVVLYQSNTGPFKILNLTPTTLTANVANGDATITASRPIFKPTHVGALFRLTSQGQSISQVLAGADQYSDTIRVSGVGQTSRLLTIVIAGTWVGVVTLQRSFDEGLTWAKVDTHNANGTFTWDDTSVPGGSLENVIALYRVAFIGSDYTSGSATVTLSNPGSGITGVVRIFGYTSATSVAASVLSSLGGTNATSNWSEGDWSDYRGWPTSLALDDGRLWHAGRAKLWGSVSDDYENFDDSVIGDAGPISRSIGRGPVDVINWLLSMMRMVAGAQGSEITVRSSALDEPLTPTNFNLKYSSTQGSSGVPAIAVDSNGFFVQKSGRSLYRLQADPYTSAYGATNQSVYVHELLLPGIIRIAVQRKPETRIHCVLGDGTVMILLFDEAEDVSSWQLFETDGDVEDVAVLPGQIEDQVYYTIARVVNASIVRYIEKWARDDECLGGTLNKQADSFLTYSGAPTTTLTAPHLANEQLIVWADGFDYSPDDPDTGVQTLFTADGSGNITLPAAVSNAVFGRPYMARWQSTKLAYAAQMGTALTMKKIISQVGLVLADAHPYGLKVGQDFDHLDDLPLVRSNGAEIDPDTVQTAADIESFPINGTWDTDSRLCLQAKAPRSVCVLAAVIGELTSDKS